MRKYGRLLGKAPLGRGQAGAVGNKPRFLGPPYYLINDTFTTDRAAGAVNGTKAEPGPAPGGRVVTDTESKLSISSGALSITPRASAANGDPGLWYGKLTRLAGLTLIAQATPAAANKALDVGFDSNQAGLLAGPAVMFRGTGVLTERIGGSPAASLMSYSGAIAYAVAVVIRAAGHFIFVKSGGNWVLLWVSNTGTTNPLYPIVHNFDATATVDYLKVPAALWLPTPLASDGFSAWGTTDGLGHAEGVASGLGAGGSGLAWADVTGGGTWSAAGGAAVNAGGTGVDEIAHVNTGKADVIASAKFARVSDSGGVVVRCDSNGANYVKAVHNGTNAQLIKVVGGTPTTLINTAATYVAGAEIRIICDGTKFRLYYNNALIGAEQTIADAGLASGTRQGLVNTNGAGNTFDDFMVRARGTGGEYSALDNY